MNYGEIKKATLKLINQYSIAGDEINSTYNNQDDYLARIPELVNDAMIYIATTVKRISAIALLEELQKSFKGEYTVFTLPENVFEIKSGGIYLQGESGSINVCKTARHIGNTILIPTKDITKGAFFEYYRYPHLLSGEPEDSAMIDNTVETQIAIPYYVAAHIVMQDDSFQYASLYNEFENKLSRLRESVKAEFDRVSDDYGIEVSGGAY